jgi:hypothetical protein
MKLNCRSAARAAAAQNYFPTKYEIPGCNGNCRNIFMWFCGSIRTANTRTNQFRILPTDLPLPTKEVYSKNLFAATPESCKDWAFLCKESRFFRTSIFDPPFLGDGINGAELFSMSSDARFAHVIRHWRAEICIAAVNSGDGSVGRAGCAV